MTISNTPRKAGPYAGNGSATTFAFAFKVFSAADVLVVRADTATGIETTLTLTTDYTVSLNADQDTSPGGTITTTTAPATGQTITLSSDMDYTQPVELTNNGGFYPRVINDALDRLTIGQQQLKELTDRTLKVAVSTPSGVDTTLPAPSANKLIGWNPTADNLQNMDPTTLATIAAFGTANADIFSGDGVTTQFALSANPGALNNLDVSIGGATKTPTDDYTWSGGTTITFTSAPPAGTNNILVRYMQGLAQGQSDWGATLNKPIIRLIDFGADPTGVSDATAALTNAISAAKAAGINAVDCSGGKWNIDTGGITLTNITLFANSPPDFGNTYGDTGGTFLLTSTTTSPFILGQGWAIKGITFQYPAQDGDDAVPLVFPPLFIGTYVAGGVMEDVTVLNAYQIFKFNVGIAIGDFRLDRCRMYAVDRVFWFLEGAPEVINITDCIFSPGMYVPALTPNTYLRNYTATSGEFMRIDVGGGANTSVDGLNISSTIVYGYRYGIRVMSGLLNVSSVHDCWFDAVSTALSIEGTATIANTRISDNYFWSSNLSDASTSYATIALSAASASNLKIAGNDFVYSQGDHISWNAASTNDVHISGNRFKNWGKENTAPAASYYAINATDSNLNGSIVGNKFQPSSGAIAHNRNGIGIGNCTDLAVLSNEFDDCYLSLWAVAGTKYKVIGNVSKGSGFSAAFLNGCSAGVVESSGNRWDKAPSGPSGSPSFTVRAGTQTFTGAKAQVVFSTESIDSDANFASDTFTAPTTDDYEFYVQLNNATGLTAGDVWTVTIEQAGGGFTILQNANRVAADVAGSVPLTCSGMLSLTAADTVKVYVTRVSGTGNYVVVNSANYNVFSGRRIS